MAMCFKLEKTPWRRRTSLAAWASVIAHSSCGSGNVCEIGQEERDAIHRKRLCDHKITQDNFHALSTSRHDSYSLLILTSSVSVVICGSRIMSGPSRERVACHRKARWSCRSIFRQCLSSWLGQSSSSSESARPATTNS